MAGKDLLDGRKEWELGELPVSDAARPDDFEAEVVAVQEPLGALLDRRLLQVVGERSLAGPRSGARQDVAASVKNAECGVRNAEWVKQRNNTEGVDDSRGRA